MATHPVDNHYRVDWDDEDGRNRVTDIRAFDAVEARARVMRIPRATRIVAVTRLSEERED